MSSHQASEKSKIQSGEQKENKPPQTGLETVRRILGDTFVLYMKTYAIHWNLQGPQFLSVHHLTENHYKELAQAIDDLAERMRALGDFAPVSLLDILDSSGLKEMTESTTQSNQGIENLARTHKLLAEKCMEAIAVLQKENDVFSVDMLTKRVGAHDKAHWMLTSMGQSSEVPAKTKH